MADSREMVRSRAKINLSLRVLGRLDDGYHEIRSVIQEISLSDELTFVPREDERITVICPAVPEEENLVTRAALLVRSRAPGARGFDIRIDKRIPVGAGLGGGSSNAAAALATLNRLWGVGLTEEELHEIAGRIGSDVPFFLTGGRALVEGRGEIVRPLADFDPPRTYLVITPPFPVATRSVYTRWKSPAREVERPAVDDITDPAAGNDLFEPACMVEPRLRDIDRAIRATGPECHRMSGSGSSFWATYAPGRAEDAARTLTNIGRVFIVESVPRDGAQAR